MHTLIKTHLQRKKVQILGSQPDYEHHGCTLTLKTKTISTVSDISDMANKRSEHTPLISARVMTVKMVWLAGMVAHPQQILKNKIKMY